MKPTKLLTAVFGLAALTACNNYDIEGSWVEPVPGIAGMQQGFTLEAGGSASSINMATLQYEKWEKKGDMLILSGKSIGNRQSIDFTDTLTIEKLTQDSLILKKGGLTLRYAKTIGEAEKDTIPATKLVPAKKTVKGTLYIGHEVRSFRADGDTLDYWIVDETDRLLPEYDRITDGVKNGKPVYIEMEVIDKGKADDGFAADYSGVYHITDIHKIEAK